MGGIVGGLLGAYLGNKGANTLLSYRNIKKIQEITKNLETLQKIPQGYWVYDQNILDILQINYKILNEQMPPSLK